MNITVSFSEQYVIPYRYKIKEIEKETEKDDEFMKTILSLKEKLMCCSDSDMLRLLNAVGNDFLPTYPPFEFSVKYTEV